MGIAWSEFCPVREPRPDDTDFRLVIDDSAFGRAAARAIGDAFVREAVREHMAERCSAHAALIIASAYGRGFFVNRF